MTQQPTASPADTYENYLGPALFTPCARLLLAKAAPLPGEKAIDVACGTGIAARYLAPALGHDGHITGIDISPPMLSVARRKVPDNPTVDWREGSADELPVDSQSVDLVVCQQGLQFFPDRLGAAREMHRVLKPQGRAALAVWAGLEEHEVFRILMEAEAAYLDVPVESIAVPFSLGDPAAIKQLLYDAGFSEVDLDEATFNAELPDPERFIEQIVLAGAAVIPELNEDDPAERAALIEAVSEASRDALKPYQVDGYMRVPMDTYLVTATKH